MIIEAISPSLILDEFPNRGSRFTYMLSKPMSLNDVPYSPFLRIYTSPYIKRSIVKDLDDSMVEECIIPLTNEGVVNYMRLSNDREVQVRVLPTQSCTQNVMFLFTTMNDQKPILYTGEFTEYRSIQYNKWFQKVQGQIDHLYIDKTLSQMPRLYENSIPKTCKAIRELVDRFSGYKLHFMIESVGYEDLLVALAKIYDKQVYLDRIRSIIIPRDITTVFSQSERMSKIIVKDLDLKIRTPLAEVEKKFVKDKVITVKFTKEECFWLSKLANYRSNVYRGLCLIQYTPHPSPIDILDFIESAKAKNVHPIQHRSN